MRNGRLITLEGSARDAQALAAHSGKIVAIGTNATVKAWIGPSTRVIDLKGRLAIPGFIEGHGHFTELGASKMMLDLRGAKNWDEIVAMVAAAAKEAKPGTWILGSGFHQAKWDRPPEPNVRGFPVEQSLSLVSPRNPVWLTHASGHAGFANGEALREAGVNKDTADPAGGEILRDGQGNPTGLLNERAQELMERVLHAGMESQIRQQIKLAERECLSKGITTFEDAGSSLATVDLFRKMAEQGELSLRLWVMLRAPQAELAANLRRYYMMGAGGEHLTVRAIKEYMDGALGSRGAWLLAPYSDLPAGAPNGSGINTENLADIRETAELAINNGFQLCTHAIGDRANREVLNLYESVFREHPDKKDSALADRARAASGSGRYSALREAGCDRRDARDPLHFGRAVRDRTIGARASRGGRVCMAEADEIGRNGWERDRYAGGGCGPHPVLLRFGEPAAEGRDCVFSGSADEQDGGAAVVHDQQCVCGV